MPLLLASRNKGNLLLSPLLERDVNLLWKGSSAQGPAEKRAARLNPLGLRHAPFTSSTVALGQWELRGWKYPLMLLKNWPKGIPISRLASTLRTILNISEMLTVWTPLSEDRFTLLATTGQGHVVSFPSHWTPRLLWDGTGDCRATARCSNNKVW